SPVGVVAHMRLLPRLPLGVARELAEERAGIAWEQLARMSSPPHPRAYWAASGTRITEAELRDLQRRVTDVMSDAMSRGTLEGNRYLDITASRVLLAQLRVA